MSNFDLSTLPLLVAKVVETNMQYSQYGLDLSGKQKLFYFHCQRLRISTTSFDFGLHRRHLWLFTSHIVLLVAGCGPAKRHVHRAPVIKERRELFVLGSVCDWWLSACLQRPFNWPEGESRRTAAGSIHMVPILLRPIVNIIKALLGLYFCNLFGVFKANGQV